MKRKISVLVVAIVIAFTYSACNVSQGLSGAYSMINCKYSFNSISGLTVSGMDFSKGFSVSQLPLITSALTGKSSSIPVNFNLNMDIKNPNEATAMLHGLQYIVNIDNIQFTTGQVNKALNIGAGESEMLPISIGLDLATLMQENSKESILDIAKNLIGMGNKESQVTLQIKPTFMIGNTAVTSPAYLPVNFSFGGKK